MARVRRIAACGASLAAAVALLSGTPGWAVAPAAQARAQLWPGGSPTGFLAGRPTSPVSAPSLWRPGFLASGGGLPRAAKAVVPAGGGWSVEPTPNKARLRNGSLTSDSCTSEVACTAVGSYENAAGTTVPVAERWNGTSWHLQVIPAPAGATASLLTGVSCATAGACTAVGYYFDAAGQVLTLAEGWDGSSWQALASPSLTGAGSGFFSVSCTAANACMAVGIHDSNSGESLALAERWDGSSWNVLATPISLLPAPSTLLGVSCTGISACTAVGGSDDSSGTAMPLAMAWNGTTWKFQATTSPASSVGSGFSGVSCGTVGACIAVGSYDTSDGSNASLAESWNGSGWVIQTVPSPAGASGSQLQAVSCAADAACTAVGAYFGSRAARPASGGGQQVRPLAQEWNGIRWRVLTSADPAASVGGGLAGVSCAQPGACIAIGSYDVAASQASLALAESWNGTAWKLQPAISPAGANASELAADSCASARTCAAVGFYARTTSVVDTLAEMWNGTGWHIQATPDPAGATSSILLSVSCRSAHACTAVGSASNSRGRQLPLAEAWNGSHWTIQAVPSPPRATGVSLYGVSCGTPRTCTAVGFYDDHAGQPVALAERWNGMSWRIQALPKAAKLTWLFAVSCASASSCTAVGYLNKGKGDAQPLAEAWNGAAWRAQHVPRPSGSPGGAFRAVSCTSSRACTATGASFSSTGAPLAERWNGAAWQAQPTVAPIGYQTSTSEVSLVGVSCTSARACTAIGSYTPDNNSATFAETWDGTSWQLRFTVSPTGAAQSVLNGLSCLPRSCQAVGAYFGPSGAVVTLAESDPS